MKFRVEGIVYDLELLEEEEHDCLLLKWHKTTAVECLCQGERHNPNPLLYVRRVNDGLFFANYPSNTKNDFHHDFKCRYNRQGYRSLLEDKGVRFVENEIRVKLDVDVPKNRSTVKTGKPLSAKITDPKPDQNPKKRERPDPKVQLDSLFYTMLQEYKVTEYRPGGRRNIASRLLKVAQYIILNGKPLSDMLYVADNKRKWPRRENHQLIIG